ncbi:DUF3536 domain-containing protein [Candidatus Omnitrophota bacterium]
MNRNICIHGHFYQPPRENPWLEEVELQDSAYPYHDWNARITAECYAPNTASRILGPDKKIIDIINNYSKISFNFGPTLLAWLERHELEVYQAILQADKESMGRFSGHGSALAQVYNHMIMPLANSRDTRTQITWGIKDFERRFGRKPEGMWLAETAVDLEALEILAECGVAFTILAPNQARRARKIGDNRWKDVSNSRIDPKVPYHCGLPSGKSIALFFYDGPISQEIAFGSLLKDGEIFAKRLMSAFVEKDENPQLVHIATDGETYGHHQNHGDMALTYCLNYLESNDLAKITIYGEYLEKHPPLHEVEIIENSSWSCVHGVERWKSNCGCSLGMHQGWTQEWRAPLRGALDWLRDNLERIFEEQLARLVDDPWKARDAYIDVVLDRSDESRERFLSSHAAKSLDESEKIKALQLFEMQRNAMFMYTSCGWFFDEISGIETVQVIQYAARAMQLAEAVSGISLEESFVKLIERAPSNIPELENGLKIYNSLVKPAILDLMRVGWHYGVSSLFREYKDTERIYIYEVKRKTYDRLVNGKQRLAIGAVEIVSGITQETETISFMVLYLGDHNISGGAGRYQDEDSFKVMRDEMTGEFTKGDLTNVINLINKNSSSDSYSLRNLFRDEQRKIINEVLSEAVEDAESSLRRIYERHEAAFHSVELFKVPLPSCFSHLVGLMVNAEMCAALDKETVDLKDLTRIVQEITRWSITVDKKTVQFLAGKKIDEMVRQWSLAPKDPVVLGGIIDFMNILSGLGIDLNLWRCQNAFFFFGKWHLSEMKAAAEKNDANASRWVQLFRALGDLLKAKIE